eukprot:TRINITY_DN4535_c0_g1_i1.p1 TRINITY_DN4535_c0_g1~~TRINITY_DN4535_c0_g1_i1.p1  ORF type:complete len:456 (+),score=114.89 TRINITY_DN4535_c0_g1_i1:48-1415(+)
MPSERCALFATAMLTSVALAALLCGCSAPSPSPSAAALAARRLLVASHGRLQWLDVGTGAVTILHEGRGVYYGTFAGEPRPAERPGGPPRPSLWAVSRRQGGPASLLLANKSEEVNTSFWDDGLGPERLLHLDAATGELLGERRIPSRFTHDAVRTPDGFSVLLADTGRGNIVELDYPSLKRRQTYHLFERRDHINTLAPANLGGAADGRRAVWAMLHSKGRPSMLVEVDISSSSSKRTPPDANVGAADGVADADADADADANVADATDAARLTGRRLGAGQKAHGAVLLSGGAGVLTLDSKRGRLLRLRFDDADGGAAEVVWADPAQRFLKGLCVVDGIAYLGANTWGPLQHRVSRNTTADVLAVDLESGALLWSRTLETWGTLNVVVAPQLGSRSPYQERSSWAEDAGWLAGLSEDAAAAAAAAAATNADIEDDDYDYYYYRRPSRRKTRSDL